MMSEKSIRKAMDARLSGIAPSEERRLRLAQSARAGDEKPRVARKTALVLLAAAVLLAGSVAVGAGLNLFAYLGGKNPVLEEMADQSLVTDNPVFTITHEKIGTIEAGITNAYFDGETLLVGHFLSNYGRTQYGWTPTEEMLAQMTLLETNPYTVALEGYSHSTQEKPENIRALRRALETGTPWGVEAYSVFWGVEQANGLVLDYNDNWYEIVSEPKPRLYEVIEYQPLPEELREKDELHLSHGLHLNVVCQYFDGQNWYEYRTCEPIGEITAVVVKTKN